MIGAGEMTHKQKEKTMDELRIIGMNLRLNPEPDHYGTTTLADFDFAGGFLSIHGSRLVRTRKGHVQAWMPRHKVRFVEKDKLIQLVRLAKQTFADLGGDRELLENPL